MERGRECVCVTERVSEGSREKEGRKGGRRERERWERGGRERGERAKERGMEREGEGEIEGIERQREERKERGGWGERRMNVL